MSVWDSFEWDNTPKMFPTIYTYWYDCKYFKPWWGVNQFCVNQQINIPYIGGEHSDVASLKANWLNKWTGYNDSALKTDLHFSQQRLHNKTLSSRRVATDKYCRAWIWRPWSKKCQQSLYFWFSTTYFAVNILKNFFIEEPRNSRHLDSDPSKY